MLRDGREKRRAERLLQAARRQVEAGRLDVAREMLCRLGDDRVRVRMLMDELNDRQLSADACLRQAEQAIAREDWATALEELRRARDADPSDARVVEASSRLVPAICSRASALLSAGRIDQAAQLVDLLGRSSLPPTPAVADLSRAISACRAAVREIANGRAAEAVEHVQRVTQLFPKLAWSRDTLDGLRQAAEALARVRVGPLGLLLDAPAAPMQTTAPPVGSGSSILLSHRAASPAPGRLPSRFVLRVDGVGGFVVVTGDRITVGPVSGSTLPCVPLVTDPSAVLATIERRDEDYFIHGGTGLVVNDRPATQRLLASGDRIALSPRCRLAFSLPHAATTTAALDLVSARYPRGDVRRVILLDSELVIGAGPTSHVRLDALPEPIVLQRRGASMQVASSHGVEVARGSRLDRCRPLPFDTPLKCQGVSFVLTHV